MPWKFHTSSQRFFVVSPGAGVRIKMTPWKSRKYMDVVYDYESFDFWARSVQETNMKCLDFDLKAGQVLYIPPYWFYSVEFLSDGSEKESKISFLASFTFATPMNMVANADAYGYSLFLQTSSSSSSSSTTSITKTIIPFSSSKKEIVEEEKEKEKEKEEENVKTPNLEKEKEKTFDKQTTKEIQEMLSVIETQKTTVDLALGLNK
jgi:hypothetical protein